MALFSGLKAVFLDLDDTLVLTSDATEAARLAVQQQLEADVPKPGIDAATIQWKELFRSEPWDPEGKIEVKRWRASLWARAVHDTAGVQLPDQHAQALQTLFDTTRLKLFQFEQGVAELARFLHEKGVSCVIITNGEAKVQREKLKACKLSDLFKHVIIGGEEILQGAAEKPAASIFRKACGLVGCEPAEAIHVGDSLAADIQGAVNAKLQGSVWVNRHALPAPAEAPAFTAQITHISELQTLLAPCL